MTFQMLDMVSSDAVIKVIGVGGGGGNAVAHMLEADIEGVDFICANTDAQALKKLEQAQVLQIGQGVTKGLGAGADPDTGRQAALEDRELLQESIQGADMLFITAGMGGGTGTGAAPVIAQIARDLGILTVAVVTKPFSFEGKRRMSFADNGMQELAENVDSLITIPNDKLMAAMGPDARMLSAFAVANDVLKNAVQGISELITLPGLINVDFADVRTVMGEMGMAMMGSGTASGENRVAEATQAAISSPLLEDIDLKGARGILVNVISGMDITIGELNLIGDQVQEIASDDAQIVYGAGIDMNLQDELRVTIVATGLNQPAKPAESQPQQQRPPIEMVKRKASGEVDYAGLDTPTAIRRNKIAAGDDASQNALDEKYVDIPTFLRRQAD